MPVPAPPPSRPGTPLVPRAALSLVFPWRKSLFTESPSRIFCTWKVLTVGTNARTGHRPPQCNTVLENSRPPQGHGCEPGFGGTALRGAEVGGAGGPFAMTLGEPPSFPGCTGPRRIRRPLPLPPIPQHADAWDTFQVRCQPKDIESKDIMEEREFQRQDTNAKCRAEHGGVRVTGIGWVGTCFTRSF